MTESASIQVSDIPNGHIIVGHVVVAKVFDNEGQEYWATRHSGLNDMETYGMMINAVDCMRSDLTTGRVDPA